MKMNETIRKYRKEQNLTQEQVANYLGVTAPAVNKWEKGISYPDITLLAPLARVLNINVDTLLSFKEELTDIEINQFAKEISDEMNSNSYETIFEKASNKIKEYPNCDKLLLTVGQLMNAYLLMRRDEIIEQEKYQKQIKAWFEKVVFSKNTELANMAIMSLSQDYMVNGEYEEAQKLLDQIPPMGFDKRMLQAKLFEKQGQYDKAYELQESMLYQYMNSVISSLMQLISLLCGQEDYETALRYSELIANVANQFDLGIFVGASSKLEVYIKMQNEEKSIEALEEIMAAGIDSAQSARDSNLYQHMTFKEADHIREMDRMMKKYLEEDKELDFLRENKRFKALISKLK